MRTGAIERGPGRRGGFTLIELLVVIFIILIVSAAALPVVLPALNNRQLGEGARLLQGAIVGAQDAAVHANAPRGIRLMPDTTFPLTRNTTTGELDGTTILASNRIVPLEAAPDYSEGRLTPYRSSTDTAVVGVPVYDGGGAMTVPAPSGGGTVTVPAALVVEEAMYDKSGFRNNPTSWFWNVRVGDKIRVGKSGWLYTVTGPMDLGPEDGNVELFVNVGVPGTASPLTGGMETIATSVLPDAGPWGQREFLYLVNGRDDNGDGLIDSGWDGLDNNLNGGVDENSEWEAERWVGGVASAIGANGFPLSLPYTIVRRPVPSSSSARETALPADVVIDMTTWASNFGSERSRLPVDRFTGYVDIMFSPRGEVIPTTIYSTPASSPMTDAFYHFWLAERQDLYDPLTGAGAPEYPPFLPITQGLITGATNALKGEQRIVTLFTRTGQVVTNSSAAFDLNASTTANTDTYSTSRPFISAQQGARGGQ